MKKEQTINIFDKETKKELSVSILWMVIGTVLQAVPYLLIFFMIRSALSSVSLNQVIDSQFILKMAIGIVVSVLLGMTSLTIGGIAVHKKAFQILHRFRVQVTDHLMRVNLGFFTSNASGKIKKIIGENIESIEEFIAHLLPNIINGAVLLVILLGFMFYLNVWLALAVIFYIILAFSLQAAVMGGKNIKSLLERLNSYSTDISVNFTETIKGIEEIKMFQTSESQMKGIYKSIDVYKENAVRFLKRITPLYEGYKAIITSLVPCLFPVIYLLISNDAENIELLTKSLMIIIVTPAIYPAVVELVELGSLYLNVSLKLDEINKLMDYQTIAVAEITSTPSDFEVRFSKVDFTYTDKSIIKDLNFTIESGTTTALIGASGCGKSTIAHLLMRFFETNGGDILIGDVSLKNIDNNELMKMISFVSQDTYLFSNTILYNITMGEKISFDRVKEACKKARCLELIEGTENGFETVVGNGGHKLSGGEAQRISIARAILKNAPILVLDEPMASADTENEHYISEALRALSKDKTVLAIAHRLKNIAYADQIIVLDQGVIKEKGTHEELMLSEGIYHYYYDMQQNIDNWHVEGVVS